MTPYPYRLTNINLIYKLKNKLSFCCRSASLPLLINHQLKHLKLEVTHTEHVWLSDITYIRQLDGFSFLSLVTDAYSRKIVGYCLYPTLAAFGPLLALRMAITNLTKPPDGLIHHSDRGIQYCCDSYIQELQLYCIDSSMTDNGDPYENAIAERLNGILKKNFQLKRTFKDFGEASAAVIKAVDAYNNLRPHQSVSMLTPSAAHQPEYEGKLNRTWKSKPKAWITKPINAITL